MINLDAKIRKMDMDIKSKISGLQHVGISSHDLAASESFYRNLGFEKIYTAVSLKGCPIMFMRMGDILLEFVGDGGQPDNGAVHFALNVTGSIEEVYAAVVATGAEVVTGGVRGLPFWDNGIKFFMISGPDGERIEFNQVL